VRTSAITATLPAADLGRARAFYIEKVGLQTADAGYLNASDGRLGLAIGDGVNQLVIYPAEARSRGDFMQAVLQVSDVRAAVEQMRNRGVHFEEYATAETQTVDGVAQTPDGREAAWFKDSEGNLIGVVTALAQKALVGTVAASTSVYVISHIDIIPIHVEAGRDLLVHYSADVRGQPGLTRFELLHQLHRPNHFETLAVWDSESHYVDSLSAQITLQYRERLHPLLGSPFDDRVHVLEDI
jgi:quinol monooxygenase YgiN/predicted enzyme related to lactoylglutathione lyase